VSSATHEARISVVIGVYNAVDYLGEAIDSVFAQTHRPSELIVVDDGSDDGSADVARSYGDALRYVYQPRQGNGAARNRGVELATGDLLAFLDADDRFVPDKLERQMAALHADPELEVVFGHVRQFLSPGLPPDVRARLRAPSPEPMPMLSPTLMLIRRASFARVGPFSTSLRVGVTVDWTARAIECGLRNVVLPEVLLERRLHGQNNGIREQASRAQYAHVLKAALDRKRLQSSCGGEAGSAG
jgi:glycosyltransferase involved in cell wall biosynthesis